MMTIKTTATLVAVAAALSLGACQRNDPDRTAGQKLDSTMASAEQKAKELKSDMKQETSEAKDDINRATAAAGDKVKDLSITASINAQLARDAELSALHINVDTSAGRVVLRGTAPNDAARERATSLASSISGVLGVDNQLTVAHG
ncbi:MAG: BON domain-containing protein [Rhizobacter sp.]